MNVLRAIGNTSIVQLRKVVPPNSADVFVKLEWENPTGSMKDRMALRVIDAAVERGQLQPGGTVVEYTGGSTGASEQAASAASRSIAARARSAARADERPLAVFERLRPCFRRIASRVVGVARPKEMRQRRFAALWQTLQMSAP